MSPSAKSPRILLIDDERLIRWSLRERLEQEGYEVIEAETGKAAFQLLESDEFDLLLLDFKLPDTDGIEVLRKVKSVRPHQVVILMTAYSTIENAVEAMRLGAYDYVNKPFNLDELMLQVEKGLETMRLRFEVSRFRERDRARFGLKNLIGESPETDEIRRLVKRIAGSGAQTILIQGESGTGKGLVARGIHYESDSANRPFMNINCTALPDMLLESELFGHERGAYTDARNQKKGLLELAHTGTAFLDEIGDMPASLQGKLLHFLEEKSFRRLGGTKDINVDVRVVAATNRNLEEAVRNGSFRPDLYYRLNVIPMRIPPLRERRQDILPLVNHFVSHYNAEFKKSIKGFNKAALKLLDSYPWPGNIRELKNAIERAILLTDSEVLGLEDLAYEIRERTLLPDSNDGQPIFTLPKGGVNVEDVERDLLSQALRLTGGNKTQAGRLLGINRDQVRYWMRKYELKDPVDEETSGV